MLKAVIVCIVAVGIFLIVSAGSGSDYYDAIITNETSEADLSTTQEKPTERAEEDGETNKDSKEFPKESINDFVVTTSTTKIPLPVKAKEEDEKVLPEQSDITCGVPPEIEGAVAPLLEGTKHNIGTTVSYTCHFGYASRSSGGFFSSCKIDEQTGEAIWTNPDVSCVSRSCGDPGYVSNARRIGNRFTFPNKVEFECEEGYRLRGVRIRYCQASGEWSGRLPTCEPIHCSPPPDLENGRVQFSSLKYGTELLYACNKGFVLKNHQLRLCTSDGKWSNNEPECIETRCKIPDSPERGSVQLLGDPKVGSLAIYSCNDDTLLFGTSTSKCMSSGEWTFDAPKCMRYCKINDVKDGEIGIYKEIQVYKYRNNKQFTKFQIDESVKHNETVILRCKSGFAPANRSTIPEDGSDEVLCNDGVWNKPMQCQPTLCLGDPPPIENGVPVVNARHHGMVIWYQCNSGARKAKPGRVTCDYGTWKGNTPVCATTSCYTEKLNFPGLLKPRENVYRSGTSFTITCDQGYQKATSKHTIKCSTGKWDIGDNPCVKETCDDDPPSVMNGRPLHFTRESGSEVHYECDERFSLTGTSTVRCGGIKWEGEPPLCEESVKMKKTTSRIESERTSTGQASGITSKPLIASTPVQEDACTCAYYYATDLVTATVNKIKLEPGDRIERNKIVSFSCLQPNMILVWPNGFRLFGVANITCNTCETYHEVPTCETQRPGDTAIAYNEKMKILPGGVIEFKKEENIQIRCMSVWSQPIWNHDNKKDIYVAKGHPTTVANTGIYSSYMYIDAVDYDHTGRYECFTANSDKEYRSTRVDLQIAEPDVFRCQELETNTRRGIFTIVYENDRKVNSKAYYACKDNTQKLIGENSRTCLETGKWSSSFPSCSDITCFKFPTYNSLVVSYTNDDKVGSIAKFRCSGHGTILVGSNSSVCQYNGTWSNAKPNCEMLDIRCPVVDGKGIFDIFYSNDRKINSTAQFFCRAPDQKVDGCTFMTCQQNGEWSGNYPTCIDYVTCARFVDAPGVFEVIYSDGVRVGSTASFRCLHPYTLQGVSSTTCRNDGIWSHSPPSCEVPKCSIDTLMSNAPEGIILDEKEISEEFVQYGTELQLLCEDDLVLLGSSKALCEGGGKWKYGNVQCVPGCRLINSDISPHLHIEPALEYYLFGDFVLLSCPPGQKLSTEIERVMCLGKSWSDPFPDCIEIKETTPPSTKGTTRKFI